MVASWAAGAAVGAGAGKTLFDYNRENFLYDRKMRQETEYQIMEFRLKQAELWRDDVRDIIGLTSVKMDTYLIVNAVQLGFCVMAFCEGRLAAGTPTWLIGCHTLSLAGAFTYLLMSVWLAMHATVAAKSYETRLLTQLVRLPVPSWAQLEGARTYGSAFEKVEPRQMFRVPFAMGTQEGVLARSRTAASSGSADAGPTLYDQPILEDDAQSSAGAAGSGAPGTDTSDTGDAATDPWGLERRGDKIFELDGTIRQDPRDLRHIQLVREAQQHWQSYDGFARVSMSIGTNQLVFALSYYVLGYVLVSNHAVVAAWLAVVLFVSIACGMIRLDMSLTKGEWVLSCILCMLGPFCMSVTTRQWAKIGDSLLIKVLSPVAYFSHTCWMLFLLYISKIDEQKGGVMLPIGFRSVMYLDVFGWIKSNHQGGSFQAATVSRPGANLPVDIKTGAGPGVQNVQYMNGQPVPVRVEDLPGAARPPRTQSILKKEFDPTTFAPREKLEAGEAEIEHDDSWRNTNAGARPWKVFCGATSLLAVLWGVSGILVTMQMFGINAMSVAPLLREAEHEVVEPVASAVHLLQGGVNVHTSWPHANVRPLGLSCDGDAQQMVASTRFGLFTADIGGVATRTKKPAVSFIAAPVCESIEGEALQDVSVQCHAQKDGRPCQALVLHQQGRRISTCDLSKPSSRVNRQGSNEEPTVTSVADAWLGPESHSAPEGMMALASAPQCSLKNKDCAFIGTSSQRIVEMDRGDENSTVGSPEWFPNRLVREKSPGSSSMSSGALHFINKRYLGLLLTGSHRLEVLDLEHGGAVAGSWALPEDSDWNAMCATGDDLYLLSKGPSPELWHFPVPAELRQLTDAPVQSRAALNRRQGADQASLAPDNSMQRRSVNGAWMAT